MPINFGSSGIGEIYYGSTPIKEVYSGSQLVWSSAPAVNPLTFGASTWLDFKDGVTDKGTSPQSFTTEGVVTDGYLENRYATSLSSTLPAWGQPISVSVWVKRVSNLGGSLYVAYYSAANAVVHFVVNPSTGECRWGYQHGLSPLAAENAGTVPPGEWSHMAAIIEPVSGTTWRHRCYINGVEVRNATWDAGTQTQGGGTVVSRVGQSGQVRLSFDDYAVFQSALSAADVAALYVAGRSGGVPPAPEAWPHL